MEVKSPIANFIEVLKRVTQTAQAHGAKLKANEAATRASLIDPVLSALGWDLTNPDMVEFEKHYGKTFLDYALFDCSSHVVAIVEAKALAGDLTSTTVTAQILSYGFTYSLHNIILTDGITWHHYSDATPGSYTPESINLSTDNLISCADFFLNKLDVSRFWLQATSVTIMPVLPKVLIPVPTPPIKTGTPIPGYQPLTSLPKDLKGQAAPKSVRLPDGKIVKINYWTELLVECAKFVLQVNPSIPIPLLDKAGKTRALLDHVKPDIKYTFSQTTYNGQTVYILTNYDSGNCVGNALHILGFLPKGSSWQPVEVAF